MKDVLGLAATIGLVVEFFAEELDHYQLLQELQGLHHLRGFIHHLEYFSVEVTRMASIAEANSCY